MRRVKGRNMYMMFMSTILNCKLAVDKYIHKLLAGDQRHMKRNITYMYTYIHTHVYVQCASIVHITHYTYKYHM